MLILLRDHFISITNKSKFKNMVTLFITFFTLLQLAVKVSMLICNGINGSGCCHGYKWDHSHRKCIVCEYGFFGRNCDTKCRYPTYGQDCQSKCDCDVLNCDYVNGCTQPTTKYKVHSALHTNDKTATKGQTEIHNVRSDKDISNVSTDTTKNFTYPVYETKKTEPKKNNTLMFGIIGLMTVSFIIYMMYLYTRLLEKRLVNSISQFR
ncbi:uncharacterized protein LOC128162877 [Crassostrea angulata]|uniref:uncharacterized protein LOC128162877 n=1 Tax=Magallana angulata TaxID=2784310 RepID=UPI0022B136D2|nr:uncharacterized protein LOC128162877 [Crassostrea angulata]